MRAALCLFLLMFGLARAEAATLDDAAQRYRPYVIEGIGSALAGARDLKERVAAHDLAGARKAAGEGDFDHATEMAREAEALARASVFQAKSETEAWKNLEIH